MRLKVKLAANSTKAISINYNHSLSAAIYKLLKLGSPEFSEFLHEIGYTIKNKKYKLFTFALQFEKAVYSNQALLLQSPAAYLYISSLLIDDFIKNFVIGTFEQQSVEVYSNNILSKFVIEQVELIPPPIFKSEMKLKLMTPLVLSTYIEHNGKEAQYFLRYNDNIEDINRVFQNNLINKYEVSGNRKYDGEGVKIAWDEDYISNAEKRNLRLSKKISIYKDIKNPIDIVGIFCPFKVEGDPELIKIGYECGFGEKNATGFGMTYAVE